MAMDPLSSSDPDRLVPNGCRIRTSVECRLQGSGYTALTRISCDFDGDSGVLHLRGSLPSQYLKQMAQELVIDLEGVRLVNNQIHVPRTAPRGAARLERGM